MTQETISSPQSPDLSGIIGKLRGHILYEHAQANEKKPMAYDSHAKALTQAAELIRAFGLQYTPKQTPHDKRVEEMQKLNDELDQLDPEREITVRAVVKFIKFYDENKKDTPVKKSITRRVHAIEENTLNQGKRELTNYAGKKLRIRKFCNELDKSAEGLRNELMEDPDRSNDLIIGHQQMDLEIKTMLGQLETQLKFLGPSAFCVDTLLTLQDYKEQLRATGIITTPSIETRVQAIKEKLAQHNFVALVGETGTGKTQIARRIGIEQFDEVHSDNPNDPEKYLFLALTCPPRKNQKA
ncbi:hypothetical protein HGA88_06640 [Candidatus Roizmanbacteria bacterium]|nr:hypothetical protein [Candidatus Roizmanbacteria bacterium]